MTTLGVVLTVIAVLFFGAFVLMEPGSTAAGKGFSNAASTRLQPPAAKSKRTKT